MKKFKVCERYVVYLFVFMMVFSVFASGCDPASAEIIIESGAQIASNATFTDIRGFYQASGGNWIGWVGKDATGAYTAGLRRVAVDVALKEWEMWMQEGLTPTTWSAIPNELKVFFLENVITPFVIPVYSIPVFLIPLVLPDSIPGMDTGKQV